MSPRREPVVIVDHDPAWKALYERERAVLAGIFAHTGALIEHVGSTAVGGLGAKPIVDILVGVTALPVVEARIGRLEAQGYEYVPEYESELPQRRYFRKPRTGRRRIHLHCVRSGSNFYSDHLSFRDHLRRHPEAAREYFELKRELARRFRHDRRAYTEAKSDFIRGILRSQDR